MGKLNPLGAKDIPVLTKAEDVEYPAPSAAATPTELSDSTAAPQAAAPAGFGQAVANSGDQTAGGIEFPTGEPAEYPTTNFRSFPEQPQAAMPASAALSHASADAQQGMYTTRQSAAAAAITPTESISHDDWTPPQHTSATGSTSVAAAGGDFPARDSSFGGASEVRPATATSATFAAEPVAAATPAAAATSSGVTPHSSRLAPGKVAMAEPGVSAVTTASHYEQAGGPTAGPWRPGSTTSLLR